MSTAEIDDPRSEPDTEAIDELFAFIGEKQSKSPKPGHSPRVVSTTRTIHTTAPRVVQPERPSPRSGVKTDWVDWLLRFVLTACFGFGAYNFFTAYAWSPIPENSVAQPVRSVSQPRVVTRDIEDFDVGMRAAGRNPLRNQVETAPEPNAETSRKLILRMKKESGRDLFIKLLRPLIWIESIGAIEGETFFLELPEMGAVGDAHVDGILPCPPIEEGKGNIVTGVFAHEADPETKILSVTFSNGAHLKGVTGNHPFWSVDRNDFVEIGQMKEGDWVKTASGLTKITRLDSRFARPGEMLYNLETHNEHVYQVTTAGILVHNTCTLTAYSDDLGHHVFAKRAFEGIPNYNKRQALAIGNAELKRLGLKHLGSDSLTTTQQRLFRKFAASGRPNTLAEHARIARETLIEHGMDPKNAVLVVRKAMNQLKSWGITAPNHIPWGG